jgi:hypothetical protein
VAEAAFHVRPARDEDRLPMAVVFAAVAEERDGIATEPPVDVESRAARWTLDGTFVAVASGEIVGSLHVDPNVAPAFDPVPNTGCKLFGSPFANCSSTYETKPELNISFAPFHQSRPLLLAIIEKCDRSNPSINALSTRPNDRWK